MSSKQERIAITSMKVFFIFGLMNIRRSVQKAVLGIENRINRLTSTIKLTIKQDERKNFEAYTVSIFRI